MITPGSLGLFGNWRDNLISASFRGASFFVLNSERTVGRKLRLSNPWGSDYSYIEDLGKSTDEYIIEGYIIANDKNQFNYFKERDKLIEALGTGKTGSDNYLKAVDTKWTKGKVQGSGGINWNPGSLRHPFYGEISVYLKEPARITETFEEGGIAKFSMTFIRWNVAPASKVSAFDTAKTIIDQSLSLYNDFIDSFSKWMNVGGAFTNALGSVLRTVLGGASNMINSVQGGIASTLSGAAAIANEALNFTDDILSNPCEIASTIGMGVDSILSAVGITGTAISSGVAGGCSGTVRGDIYELDGTFIPEKLTVSCVRMLLAASLKNEEDCTEPIPLEQEGNSKALADLYQAVCLKNAGMIAVIGDYVSKDLAQSTMDSVLDTIDDFMVRLGERTVDVTLAYSAMEQFRNIFSQCMYAKMEDLEQLTEYEVPAYGMNTLVLAYNKFNDISRENEIFEMNRSVLEHPGFLPGGIGISILDS